jgi:hypothetical protein
MGQNFFTKYVFLMGITLILPLSLLYYTAEAGNLSLGKQFLNK